MNMKDKQSKLVSCCYFEALHMSFTDICLVMLSLADQISRNEATEKRQQFSDCHHAMVQQLFAELMIFKSGKGTDRGTYKDHRCQQKKIKKIQAKAVQVNDATRYGLIPL
jgi:hypothetical protein